MWCVYIWEGVVRENQCSWYMIRAERVYAVRIWKFHFRWIKKTIRDNDDDKIFNRSEKGGVRKS